MSSTKEHYDLNDFTTYPGIPYIGSHMLRWRALAIAGQTLYLPRDIQLSRDGAQLLVRIPGEEGVAEEVAIGEDPHAAVRNAWTLLNHRLARKARIRSTQVCHTLNGFDAQLPEGMSLRIKTNVRSPLVILSYSHPAGGDGRKPQVRYTATRSLSALRINPELFQFVFWRVMRGACCALEHEALHGDAAMIGYRVPANLEDSKPDGLPASLLPTVSDAFWLNFQSQQAA